MVQNNVYVSLILKILFHTNRKMIHIKDILWFVRQVTPSNKHFTATSFEMHTKLLNQICIFSWKHLSQLRSSMCKKVRTVYYIYKLSILTFPLQLGKIRKYYQPTEMLRWGFKQTNQMKRCN